jgi:hypothetical protein
MARRRQPYDPNAVKRHDRTGFYSRAANLTFDEIPDPYVHSSSLKLGVTDLSADV